MQVERPEVHLPEAEAVRLNAAYSEARVILEYGSGGSTVLAAEMPGKFILSVESDRDWALRLQYYLDEADTASPATVYPVDIGETGDWGRPKDHSGWTRYHEYALSIWDEPFFRHPDVILIDGRFRPACLMTALARIERPVTVLFDDYVERTRYHVVEEVVKPAQIIGRMAEFRLEPDQLPKTSVTKLISSFAQVSLAREDAASFPAPEDGA